MSEKKLVHTFEFKWQADLLENLLRQEGIESFTILGSREYSSIVTGIGEPPVSIYVHENNFSKSQEVLKNFFKKSNLRIVESEEVNIQPPRRVKFLVFFILIWLVVLASVYVASVALM